MKTIAINASLIIACVLLIWACGDAAIANVDKGDYSPTADEIASQCEQIRNNSTELNKCLAALKNAKN